MSIGFSLGTVSLTNIRRVQMGKKNRKSPAKLQRPMTENINRSLAMGTAIIKDEIEEEAKAGKNREALAISKQMMIDYGNRGPSTSTVLVEDNLEEEANDIEDEIVEIREGAKKEEPIAHNDDTRRSSKG
uniref:Uncharacterized protein n=1 Tax=Manihot esculenta TaxID=3983 RepID=A0A2C9UTP7_MANES